VEETLTEDAVQNHLAWRVKNAPKSGIPFPYNGTYFIATSWRNSGFENVDFSVALCSGPMTSTGLEDEVGRVHPVIGTGRITMLSPMAVTTGSYRRSVGIPCEDGEGGIWAFASMADVDWVKGEFGSLKNP
jgi:hypothetical protein